MSGWSLLAGVLTGGSLGTWAWWTSPAQRIRRALRSVERAGRWTA